MTKTNPADPRLVQIAGLARRLREDRTRLRASLQAELEARLQEQENNLVTAIVDARVAGLPVTSIARAYTGPGKTPNRNKIHDYLRDAGIVNAEINNPAVIFSWLPRVVVSPEGERLVHDLSVQVVRYGPENLTGTYLFRVTADGIEPFDQESTAWEDYDSLHLWVAENPRPE